MYDYCTTPLSEGQIHDKAPSVFATQAHSQVSNRYQFISTLEMIQGLGSEGWFPVHAQENRVRKTDREGYTKHLLRFRRFDEKLPMVGDTLPEVVIVNSHDGSCSYQLHAGLFRLVCENGMVVADSKLGQVRRRHTGNAVDEVIEGTYEIVEELPRIADQVNTFRQIDLTPSEQKTLAEAALTARWDEKPPISPTQLVSSRRSEDNKDDLWTTFQRVQENLIKGGLQGIGKTGRRLTTRAIKSVDADIKLNKALWLLTQRMAELKGA
ncbi:MAG: DUF945 domain-containing protein [bacterium]|nr:DUF945 domain-containing protein [bacterium]